MSGGAHAAAASGTATWYGSYSDGCSYWWSGSAWTGASSCGGAGRVGSAADWCAYWWNGVAYTGEQSCTAPSVSDPALNAQLIGSILGHLGGIPATWSGPDCNFSLNSCFAP
jgi:hypothetical protein